MVGGGTWPMFALLYEMQRVWMEYTEFALKGGHMGKWRESEWREGVLAAAAHTHTEKFDKGRVLLVER